MPQNGLKLVNRTNNATSLMKCLHVTNVTTYYTHTLHLFLQHCIDEISLKCEFYTCYSITFRASNYQLKINKRNTRTRREICSKLTIKTLKRHYCRHSGAFLINSEHVSRLFLMFLSLTLNIKYGLG